MMKKTACLLYFFAISVLIMTSCRPEKVTKYGIAATVTNNSSVNLIGDWSFVYDWGCDGLGNEKYAHTAFHFTEKRFTTTQEGTETYEGTWETSGNHLVINFEDGGQYVGTVNGNEIEGTMTNEDGGTGCWSGNRIEP